METRGAKISAAARRPGAAAHSQNSTAGFPAASGCSAAGLPVRESQAPSHTGNSWDWTPPRSQLAGPALLEAPSPVSAGMSGPPVARWLSPHHLGVLAQLESQGHPQIPGAGAGLLNAVE